MRISHQVPVLLLLLLPLQEILVSSKNIQPGLSILYAIDVKINQVCYEIAHNQVLAKASTLHEAFS